MLALSFHLDAVWTLIGKLHPALVHFPVTCLVLAGLFEVYAWRKKRPVSSEAVLLLKIGAACAVLGAVSGWSFGAGEEDSRNLFLHRWGGIAVAVVALGAVALTRAGAPRRGYRPLAILLVPLVGGVGHLGGELAWGEGYLENAVRAIFAEREEPTVLAEVTPEERHFVDSVWPILRENCLECHGPKKQKADLRFDDRAIVLTPDYVVPGDVAGSYLAEVLRFPPDDEDRMPPAEEGPPLAEEHIATIESWIATGAAWPDGALPGIEVDEDLETGFLERFGAQVAHAETFLPVEAVSQEGVSPEDVSPEDVSPEDVSPEDPDAAELFRTVVRPTLESRCVECHGETKRKSKLYLDRRDDIFDETREWRIVVPGKPDESELLTRISLPADDEDRMPSKGDPLTEDQITAIRAWIAGGAPWEDAAEPAKGKDDALVAQSFPQTTTAGELATLLYRTSVEPTLVERCQGCHGPQKQSGDFRIDDPGSLLSVISPGRPAKSEIITRVTTPVGEKGHMPKEGRPLTPLEIEAVTAWIAAGAPFPTRSNPAVARRTKPSGPDPSAFGAVSDPDIALTPEQDAAVETALAALSEAGARAARTSLSGPEVEVSTALLGKKADDPLLAQLAGLEPALVRLDLSSATITEEGAVRLAAFRELRVLNLSRTAVGDTALAKLAALPHLEVLNLYGTQVTDAGVAALHAHPKLRRVYLWQTPVTDAGVDALQIARPELRIVRGR